MGSLVERVVLRHLPMLSSLRRVRLLGGLMHRVGQRALPRDAMVWVQVQSGIGKGLWLELNPRTGHSYYEGKVEPILQDLLGRYLRPGMIFYDLGANLGFFTMIAARTVGDKGQVFSFEPEPEMASRLKRHVERNRFSNISVVPMAVWSHTGSVTFSRARPLDSPDYGLGKVTLNDTEVLDTIEVPAISLPDFSQKEQPPDFIKCDVEGAEAEVLEAGRSLLVERGPIIACEIHSEENRKRLKELFQGLNYKVQPLTTNHFLALPARGAM